MKIAHTKGINNEKNDPRGEERLKIVSTLNLMEQIVPTELYREKMKEIKDNE